jgi:nitroreductase
MELWQALRERRSIRAYRPDPVSRETIAKVLEAARIAPSAANRQPWHFYAVTDPARREALKEAYGKEWFFGAPAVLAACARPAEAWKRGDGANYAWVDVAIAFDHLTLAAHAEGLGTCWIGAFKPEVLRRLLAIPAELEPVALTPLGYPAKAATPTERKPLGEIVTWIP